MKEGVVIVASICYHLADLTLAALRLVYIQAIPLNCLQSNASIPTSFLSFFSLEFAQLNGVDQRPVPASDASFAATICIAKAKVFTKINIYQVFYYIRLSLENKNLIIFWT